MPQLTNHSTPAERKRGCRWAVSGGMPPGTAFNLTGTEFDSAEISVVIEFTPTFDWDGNADYYLLDTTNALEYSAVKEDNAANNVLTITLGNTALTSIPAATYSPYWLVNARNVLVISGTTGANDVWLNDTQIMTAEATAWTQDRPTEIHLGSEQAGGSLFTGTIDSLQVYRNALLTEQEAADFYLNTAYSYDDDLLLAAWQMRMQDHDPVGGLSLDSGPSGIDLTLGAGGALPAKLARHHGYDFDGGDNMSFVSTGLINTTRIAFCIEFSPDFLATENAERRLYNSTGDDYYIAKLNNAAANVLRVVLGGTTIVDIAQAAYESYWKAGGYNILIVSGSSVTNLTDVYLNGTRIVADDPTAWVLANPAALFVGSDGAGTGSFFDGEIRSFRIYERFLTPIQAYDYMIKKQQKVNDI